MIPSNTTSKASLNIHDSIEGTIGQTPLVRLNRVASELPCDVYAKLEMFNPGGSVKDRIAFPMVDTFEREGVLHPGGTVVEATSGNTGVGLAIACALLNYKAVFVMPDKMSEDKIRLLRAYGARVVITPTAVAPEDPRSYYSVAKRIVAETENAVLANQYHNPINPDSHYRTTAQEIVEQTGGQVTDIIAGMGTGGTITGIARYMREHQYPVRIVGVDPVGSLLYEAWRSGGSSEGLEAFAYKVEGIGEDFIPSTLDLSLVDEIVQVDDAESFHWARRLVREEGIFCGGSSGSAFAGTLKAMRDFGSDRVVVTIFPDGGARYLTKIFNDDWMREHGFLPVESEHLTAMEIAKARGLPSLVTAFEHERQVDVINLMRQHGISQLPVVDADGRLIGMVSEVDLLEHMLASQHEHSVDETIADLIEMEISTVHQSESFRSVLPELLTSKVVIVTDDHRRPTGIITMIDALDFTSSGRVG